MVSLADFIKTEATKPFCWYTTDCCSTVSKWIEVKTGLNPVIQAGYKFSNEEEADKILSSSNLISHVTRTLRKFGFKRTTNLEEGNIGLVRFNEQIGMAIFNGHIWISRNEKGFLGAPKDNVWKAWEIN